MEDLEVGDKIAEAPIGVCRPRRPKIVSGQIVLVTPTRALEWVQLPNQCKPASLIKVQQFAALMRAGQWREGGAADDDDVVFDQCGDLRDGWQRLMAVVLANADATFRVTEVPCYPRGGDQ